MKTQRLPVSGPSLGQKRAARRELRDVGLWVKEERRLDFYERTVEATEPFRTHLWEEGSRQAAQRLEIL